MNPASKHSVPSSPVNPGGHAAHGLATDTPCRDANRIPIETQVTELAAEAADQRSAWQTYLSTAPDATLFHSLAWMDAVRRAYPHRPHYLMAYRGKNVAGVFPLFEIRSLLAGTMLVSVPYAVYGGVISDDPQTAAALLDAAQDLAARCRARFIDIRSRTAQWDHLPCVQRYATFIKDLPASRDRVLESFPRKARAEVRRARDKHKLRACFGDDQLELAWDLYSRSMRRLGSPNFSRHFFEALVEATPGQHLVSVIYDGQRAVAGLLSLVDGPTVMPYYSGSDEHAARHTGANNYLYMSLMEKAVELGLTRFDFGRTRVDNLGSYNFKLNQGFEPTPLGYQFLVPGGGAPPDLTPSNRRYHLAQQIWKRLPLAVTRPLGSWLSASIPG